MTDPALSPVLSPTHPAAGPLWLLVNAASGSNSDEATRAVAAAFAAAGHPVGRTLDAQAGLPDRAMLDQAGIATLAVFAGDGTIHAVANALEGWGGALLPLPGGTANLLARDLHGEAPAEAIAAAYPRLRRVRRPCVRTSHGAALAEVLAGPGATWSDVREELRDGAVSDVAGAAIEAIRQSTAGPMVALVDPALGKPEGYAGVRLAPHATGMTVDGYGAEGLGDLLAQGVGPAAAQFPRGAAPAAGPPRPDPLPFARGRVDSADDRRRKARWRGGGALFA